MTFLQYLLKIGEFFMQVTQLSKVCVCVCSINSHRWQRNTYQHCT